MIKSAVLQHFVRDWLAVRGIVPGTAEQDVWSFAVPKDLRERLGRSELALSFNQRALSRHPAPSWQQSATRSSTAFSRSHARRERSAWRSHLPPMPAARPPSLAKAGELGGMPAVKAEAIYQAVCHFVFAISYPSIEAADEMEVVSVDSATLEVWAQTPDLSELWGKLEPAPRKGRTSLPAIPLAPRVFDTALTAFERRMRRRSNKVLSASRAQLDEETQSIKAYYEQLIEEARNQSRRWSTRVEEREDRIHWLQLEWKRRMEEATEFWRPRVDARLVALGVQMLPRVAYRYGPLRGAGTGRGMARACCRVWDEATKAFLAPHCVECGRTGLTDGVPRPGIGILCAECSAKPRLVPPAGPGSEGKGKSVPRRPRGTPPKPEYPPLTLVQGWRISWCLTFHTAKGRGRVDGRKAHQRRTSRRSGR